MSLSDFVFAAECFYIAIVYLSRSAHTDIVGLYLYFQIYHDSVLKA